MWNISGLFAQEKAETNLITIEIKTSAVCGMCKSTIEKTLSKEEGVNKSTLDVKTKVVTVSYDTTKTSPEKIKKAITIVGYDADDMPADEKAYDKLHDCCKKDSNH
jgi:copper chaperone CopZ